jgi:hypothetical protein
MPTEKEKLGMMQKMNAVMLDCVTSIDEAHPKKQRKRQALSDAISATTTANLAITTWTRNRCEGCCPPKIDFVAFDTFCSLSPHPHTHPPLP